MPNEYSPACSFCGKSSAEVRKLIAGPGGVYICDSCVTVCGRILKKEIPEPGTPLSRKCQTVFRTDATEAQASLKLLKEMKRDKSISASEFISLSRRLLAADPDGKKPVKSKMRRET